MREIQIKYQSMTLHAWKWEGIPSLTDDWRNINLDTLRVNLKSTFFKVN